MKYIWPLLVPTATLFEEGQQAIAVAYLRNIEVTQQLHIILYDIMLYVSMQFLSPFTSL